MADITYDPRSEEVHRDPYPFYRRLRDEAPVFHIQDPDKDFFVLSRFDDIFTAVRTPKVFSSASGLTFEDDEKGLGRCHVRVRIDPPDLDR